MTADERSELYPDLEAEGGLVNALQLSLRSIGSNLVATGLSSARIERARRFSQVYTALEKRLFIFDFWDRGVMLGNAGTSDLLDVAKSIHAWVEDQIKISLLQKMFRFVALEPIAEPFENGTEVQWKWAYLEDVVCKQQDKSDLLSLVIAAKKRTELCNLFPFTSLASLCFSRCTGYPHSDDCPHAWPTGMGRYKVFDRRRKLVGEGEAEQAVQLLIDHLPPGCGHATKGTADDL
jgi:hypothetical protein